MTPVQTHVVDGTQAVDAQERALQLIEEAGFSKVVSFVQKPSAGATANEASVQDVPIGSQPLALHLVVLAVGTDTAATIQQQQQNGKSLAFQGQAFVQSQLKLVLGFR
jgi:hypothetical protein